MSFTEVKETGCLGNIVGSIGGVFFGFLLLLIGVVLLFWNEGRAVHMAQSLAEGRGTVVSTSSDKVDPSLEGKLVHMTGQATTPETMSDVNYGVTVPSAIKLVRSVEMFQWKQSSHSESRKKLGGGTETVTTYTYDPEWSNTLIDSRSFKQPGGHQNPPSMPPAQTFTAHQVTLGAHTLDAGLVDQLTATEPVAVDADKLPADLKGRAHVQGNVIFIGTNPSSPAVGDVRVTFTAARPQPVSIVAVQSATSFAPYHAKAGGNDIELLSPGTVDSAQMFTQQEAANETLAWVLRGVGFVLIFFGLMLFTGPLVAVANVIPFLGDVVGAGGCLFALGGALLVSLVTVAVGWIAYRPLIGVLLLAAGVAAFVGLRKLAGPRKT